MLKFFVTMMVIIAVVAQGKESPAENDYRPLIIITVDVETTKYDSTMSSLPLPDQVNTLCTGNIPCGMQKMVDMLRKKNYAATFFFNVYEYKKYGEQPVRNIVRWLNTSGQDVQLHTHPQWAYDENRNLMSQYSLEEQVKIVRQGRNLLQSWTDNPVIAHRAGAYGADENTLKALIENNILFDSSLFIGSDNAQIRELPLKRNVLSMYGSLYEFPVTSYKKMVYSPALQALIRPVEKIRKYDIDGFVDSDEMQKAMNEAVREKLDIIILFLHSFSFIREYDDNGVMDADRHSIDMFSGLLDYIHERNLPVLTFYDIYEQGIDLSGYLNKPDILPKVPVDRGIFHTLRVSAGITRQNYRHYSIFAAAVFLLLIISIRKLRKT